MWRFRYPEAEGSDEAPPKKLTLEEIAASLPKQFGFSVSLGVLSEFYSWLRLKKRMEAAASRAEQTRLELAKNPEFSPEDIERVAQTVFTAETMESGNVKGYVALAKLRIARQQVDLERRRIDLLERKAAQADQASEVVNSDLTEEQKRDRLKQIFRM